MATQYLKCIEMLNKIRYEYSTKMWKDSSPGGWYFVSLPQILSKEIRDTLKWQEVIGKTPRILQGSNTDLNIFKELVSTKPWGEVSVKEKEKKILVYQLILTNIPYDKS